MTVTNILLILVPSILAITGVYLNHMRLSRMFKENELIKVINSKNADIEKNTKRYDILWNKFEKLNESVRELNIAFIRLNSINFVYPFPFMLKDMTGKIIMVNDEWIKLNNLQREDVIGKSDYELFDVEKSETFRKSDVEVINSPTGFIVEKDAFTPDAVIIKWEVASTIQGESFIAAISVPIHTLINQCKNKI